MLRGETYRDDLAHLSDEQWRYAVKAARSTLTWFPSIKHLLDLAYEMPRPEVAALPEAKVSREEFRQGFEEFQRELRRRGLVTGDAPSPVKAMGE